jgi:hypothetical protein
VAKVSAQEAQEDSGAKGVDAAPAAGETKRGEESPLFTLPGTENYFITLPHPTVYLLHTVKRSFYLIKGKTTSAKSTAETIDNRAVMSLSFLRSDIPINLLSFSNAFF